MSQGHNGQDKGGRELERQESRIRNATYDDAIAGRVNTPHPESFAQALIESRELGSSGTATTQPYTQSPIDRASLSSSDKPPFEIYQETGSMPVFVRHNSALDLFQTSNSNGVVNGQRQFSQDPKILSKSTSDITK